MQEGAANITVHGLTSRTTNALEAYNGVLGRKIKKKGNFYAFVEEIQEEEFAKRVGFDSTIKSGGRATMLTRTRVNLHIIYILNDLMN